MFIITKKDAAGATKDAAGAADETLWPMIAKARRGFTWPGDTLAADAKPLGPAQAALMAEGEKFFTSSCANCHGLDGAGVGALGPPLADSPWVTQAPERLARIVLQGMQGPVEVAGKTWNSAMPGHQGFPGFDDQVASGLLTYLRRAWGHAGRAIDPAFIAKVRAETAGRTALWTAEELGAIDINSHYAKYAGRFGNPAAPIAFTYDGKDLLVVSGIFNGPMVELKEDHFLFAPRQIKFEFLIADDGSVPAVVLATDDGGVTLPRVSP
ncbi:MAG: c-type cytochrome [Pseudomonadales bacterium]